MNKPQKKEIKMISDVIEKMLMEMLSDEGGTLELRRNELAEKIGCVPSQINYVITSRFTPERGYVIESRRGGGGYVRITRKVFHKDEYLMHLFCSIGDTIDRKSALLFSRDMNERGVISARERSIIDSVILEFDDPAMLARVLKKIILASV